jgi:hypothetical protein
MWSIGVAVGKSADGKGVAWPQTHFSTILLIVLVGVYLCTVLLTCLGFTRTKKTTATNPYSLAYLQFGLWTIVIVGSYLALVIAAWRHGYLLAPALSPNLLWLMGFNGAAALGGAHNDHRYMALHAGDGKAAVKPPSCWSPAIYWQDETGAPDLGRLQNLIWTVVAIAGYALAFWVLWTVVADPNQTTQPPGLVLPDVSDTLLLLMGISHAAAFGRDALKP